MENETIFRIIVSSIILVSMSTSIYFRRKAQINSQDRSIAARKAASPWL